MDYLDPRKRRAYNVRLIIGYILVAIVIGLGSVIIVYGANGYGINTKTGQIVQNGLLFVNSNPGNAEIYLNGQDRHTTTSARLVLQAGNYTLTLKKAGYRDWSRQLTLSGQSVARYVYPFLFPITPRVTSLKTYAATPGLITESPDRHWLLVENSAASGQAPLFDVYDTTTLDKTTPAVQQVSLPDGLLTSYSPASKLTEVEWSTDNKNLLLEHTYPGGYEFIVFNWSRPDQSFNVDKMFGDQPFAVNLYNKSVSQLYILDQADGALRLGNTSDQILGSVIIKNVLAYKPYGKNLITYVTDSGEPAGKVAGRIWDNGQTYKLDDISAGSRYLIDFAQFSGHFYYVATSNTEDHFNIYKDPLNGLQNPSLNKAVAMLALPNPAATTLDFSANTRFIELENGPSFTVYDFETNSAYEYKLSEPLSGDLSWMDGNRLVGASGGKVFVMDYDGTNRQLLTATDLPAGGLFSTDYHHLLVIAPSNTKTEYTLQDVDMRAGTDLPKQ